MGPKDHCADTESVKDAQDAPSLEQPEAANEPQASAGAENRLPREPDRIAEVNHVPGGSTTSSKSPSPRSSSQYYRISSASVSNLSGTSSLASA